MIKKILLGLLLAVVAGAAVLFLVVSSRPDTFSISRSAVMPAPPARVFPQVNDLRKWDAWSPWAKLDPDSKVTFSGPETGEGSSMTWNGNQEVGEGTMTIVASQPAESVRLRLDFVRPFEGTSQVDFVLAPADGGTRVTWTMSGSNTFVGKAISLVMDCETLMGPQFEQGLDNMKKAVAAGQ